MSFPGVQIRSTLNGVAPADGFRQDAAEGDVVVLSLAGLTSTPASYLWRVIGRPEWSVVGGGGASPWILGTGTTATFTLDTDAPGAHKDGSIEVECVLNAGTQSQTRIVTAICRLSGLTIPGPDDTLLPLRKPGAFEDVIVDTTIDPTVAGWATQLNRWLELVRQMAIGGFSPQTIAQVYDNGALQSDQTMTLTDAKGGGIIIDGSSLTELNVDKVLTVLGVDGSGAAEILAVYRQGGVAVGIGGESNASGLGIGIAPPTEAPALAFQNAEGASVSSSGSGRLRYNQTEVRFEQSVDGGGWTALSGGGGTQTLAQTYAAGLIPSDQYLVLDDVRGQVVFDGAGGGYTGDFMFTAIGASGDVIRARRLDGVEVFPYAAAFDRTNTSVSYFLLGSDLDANTFFVERWSSAHVTPAIREQVWFVQNADADVRFYVGTGGSNERLILTTTGVDAFGGLTVDGDPVVVGSGTAHYLSYWSASDEITGDVNLTYDPAKAVLGIGVDVSAGAGGDFGVGQHGLLINGIAPAIELGYTGGITGFGGDVAIQIFKNGANYSSFINPYNDGSGTSNSGAVEFWTADAGSLDVVLSLDRYKNVFLGTSSRFGGTALPTNATGGFLYLHGMAGTPTGTPTRSITGQFPITWDSAAEKLYVYSTGAWVDASGGGGGGGTLATTYDAGSLASDQTMVLTNAKGGGVVIDGSAPIGGGGTDLSTYLLTVLGNDGSGAMYAILTNHNGGTAFAIPGDAGEKTGISIGTTSSSLWGFTVTIADDDAAPVSDVGTGRIRYVSAGPRFEQSMEGGDWEALGAATLYDVYHAGSVASDVTLDMNDAAGGGIVLDGTSMSFTGAHTFETLYDDGSGAVPGFAVYRQGGAYVAPILAFGDGDGSTISAAGQGWLRYNDTLKTFEQSIDAGAWETFGGAPGWVSARLAEAKALTGLSDDEIEWFVEKFDEDYAIATNPRYINTINGSALSALSTTLTGGVWHNAGSGGGPSSSSLVGRSAMFRTDRDAKFYVYVMFKNDLGGTPSNNFAVCGVGGTNAIEVGATGSASTANFTITADNEGNFVNTGVPLDAAWHEAIVYGNGGGVGTVHAVFDGGSVLTPVGGTNAGRNKVVLQAGQSGGGTAPSIETARVLVVFPRAGL